MAVSVPPLLLLAEGRRARPRKAPVARPKEIVLHMQIAALLRAHARPEWQWCHVPNGEHRDIRTAAKLKRMGVKKGWPDFTLVSPAGAAYFLELKRQSGRLSEDQEFFSTWCAVHGVAFSAADSYEAAIAALKHWGAINAD